MRSDIYRPTAYGAGETARQRIRITQYPQNITPQLHNPPKMCGGYKKGENPSSFGKNSLTEKTMDNRLPAGLRGRVILGKGNRMDNNEHGTNLAGVGTDYISREQAIDAVRATLLAWSFMPEWRDNKIIEAVERLPTIQPKRGRWIPVTNGRGGHECDQCHEYAPSYQSGEEHLSDFCPNCGADMRGKQDG